MIVRWSISILIFAITLFGIANQQHTPAPNQEIVLQFEGGSMASDDAEHAIALLKKELQGIGADNIKVHEQESGRLTITYFSNIDVAQVKEKLLEDKQLPFGYAPDNEKNKDSNRPANKDSSRFNLDIYEIHGNQDTGGNLVGKNAIELKSEQHRFLSPNVLIVLYDIFVTDFDNTKKEDYKFRKDIAFSVNDYPHIIPEVRAGPVA